MSEQQMVIPGLERDDVFKSITNMIEDLRSARQYTDETMKKLYDRRDSILRAALMDEVKQFVGVAYYVPDFHYYVRVLEVVDPGHGEWPELIAVAVKDDDHENPECFVRHSLDLDLLLPAEFFKRFDIEFDIQDEQRYVPITAGEWQEHVDNVISTINNLANA